jgi:hypothetical protein
MRVKKQTLALQEEMVNPPVTWHSSMRYYEVTLKSDHHDQMLSSDPHLGHHPSHIFENVIGRKHQFPTEGTGI